MAVKASAGAVLLEAAKRRRSRETFEKALGRIVRDHHGTYEEYIGLIGRVRERARRDGTGLDDAAKAIAAEEP